MVLSLSVYFGLGIFGLLGSHFYWAAVFVSMEIYNIARFGQMRDRCIGDSVIPIMTQPFIRFTVVNICIEIDRIGIGTMHADCGMRVMVACRFLNFLYIVLLCIICISHKPYPPLFPYQPLASKPISMALNWVPPPNGTLKVNIHEVSFGAPMTNGNTSGLGVVLRTSNGSLVNCVAVLFQGLILSQQICECIVIGLRRAFLEGAVSVIIETDNMDAFGAVQFAHLHQHPEVDDLIHQISTRIRDPNWTCDFRLVYSVRNNLATYLSLLGGELFCRLYLFHEPIGHIAELMNFDMGLGPNGEQFLEAPMVQEEWEIFEEIMDDGAAELADAFMENLVLQVPSAPNNELQMHDVVFEDVLIEETDEEDLFEIF